MIFMNNKRIFTMLVLVILTASISSAVTWSVATSTWEIGSAAVYNGVDFEPSGTDVNGIIFDPDTNTVCFNGTQCDKNVIWNGTDITING